MAFLALGSRGSVTGGLEIGGGILGAVMGPVGGLVAIGDTTGVPEHAWWVACDPLVKSKAVDSVRVGATVSSISATSTTSTISTSVTSWSVVVIVVIIIVVVILVSTVVVSVVVVVIIITVVGIVVVVVVAVVGVVVVVPVCWGLQEREQLLSHVFWVVRIFCSFQAASRLQVTCVFAIITKLEGVVGQVPYPEGFVNLGPLNGATRGGK